MIIGYYVMFIYIFFFLNFRLETIKIVLVLIGVGMGALTLITIFIGFLTTGAPLQHVNKTWQNRTHGHLFSRFVSILIYYKIIIFFQFILHLENLFVIFFCAFFS